MRTKWIESALVAYGCEFLLAFAWAISMAAPSIVAGALLIWLPLAILFVSLAPLNNIPRVSAGVVLADMLYEPSQARRVVPDAFWGSLARLVLQWLGGFVGYAFVMRYFNAGGAEFRLFSVWETLPVYCSGWTILAIQSLVNGLGGAMWLLQVRKTATKNSTNRVVDALRTGPWVYALCFPWGGPSFSLASYLWVQNSYHIASLLIPAAMCISTAGSALVAIVVSEAIETESATVKG